MYTNMEHKYTHAGKTVRSFPEGNVQGISIEYMIKSFNGEIHERNLVACTALQRQQTPFALNTWNHQAALVSPGLVTEEIVTL